MSLRENRFQWRRPSEKKNTYMETLVDTFERLRGAVPRELRTQLARLGVRLSAHFFVRPTKPQCSALTRTGVPCRRTCREGHTMCLAHHKQATRPVKAKCSETTAKGTPCKCKVHRGLTMCYSHAKKANALPEVPNECPICSCDLTDDNRTKTSCGHHFCTECINRWAVSKGKAVYTRGKYTTRVSCPMCRASLRILAGPRWYTYGGKAPTNQTSGAEWIERLDLLPIIPVMTREDFETHAKLFGNWLLEYIRICEMVDTDDYTIVTSLNIAGFTTRHSRRG
jgi:Ring finger domain